VEGFSALRKLELQDHDGGKLGVGIIGYSIGKAHAHAWTNLAEYYHPTRLAPRLVALAGRTKEKVDDLAARYGIEKTYEDWRKLVRDPEVELVDDCAPPFLHHDPAVLAAELGKPVVCEKPLARTAREAKAMLAAAERHRVKHMAAFNYRFVPAVAYARKLIQEGRLGKIYHYKGSYLNTNDGFNRPTNPLTWHFRQKTAGHGAIGDLGSHAADLARFLVGEVTAVCGASTTFIRERPLKAEPGSAKGRVDVDDLTVGCLRFKNGALGTLEAGWTTAGVTDFLAFEVYGSEGAVKFDLERITELQLYLPGEGGGDGHANGFRTVFAIGRDYEYMKPFWVNQGGGFSWEHTFVNELHHFARCVQKDEDVAPKGATFYDGYRNCLIMDGLVESSKSGKWVSLPS
jgi:predicted dehydrogenase